MLSITDEDGDPITISTHIAYANPYRYRGYYYDTETGLYYLQSRYYDPETGRFVNADEAIFAIFTDSEDKGSLFSYCENNVVNKNDRNGFASNTFWAGFGIQIELGGSVGFIGRSYGVEFIWYTSKLVSGRKGFPYAYRYSSGSFGLSGESLIDKVIDKLLKNPGTIFSSKLSFTVSVCVLAIWGYKKSGKGKKKFSSPDDYLGKFKTKSITIYHVKAFYSTANTCFAVGAGYDFSKWATSNSVSNYKYCSFLNDWIEKLNSIYNYIYSKAKKLEA